MNRVWKVAFLAAVALSLVVGFLAGRSSMSSTASRSSARGGAAPDVIATDDTTAGPERTVPAAESVPSPVARSGHRRATGSAELSVAGILDKLRQARQNRTEVTRLLRLLSLMEDPAVLDALLQEFTGDGIPLRGLGPVWKEVLGRFDDLRVGIAVKALLDRHLAEGRSDSQDDLRALWELAISKLGGQADAAILSRLTDASLPANSIFRVTVLDAVGAGAGSEVRGVVAEQLKDPNAAVSAFRALLRIGDDVSRDLALQHVLNLGHHAIVASQYLGPYLTDQSTETLRRASASDPRNAAAYLAAVSGAAEDRIRHEAPFVKDAAALVLRGDAGDAEWVVRSFSAEALLRMADSVADPELVRLAREQAKISEVGRENLLKAARRMEEALANR